MIKIKLSRLFFFLCVFPFVLSYSFGEQGVLDLLARIQSSLEQKDIAAYLDILSPDIREREEKSLRARFEQLYLDNVTVFKTGKQINIENGVRTYLNVMFEMAHSVVIEVWRLDLENSSGQWRIKEKGITRDVRNLYKIMIPSGLEERVSRVEIKHADIQITFHDPVVYYDNIPDVETALLVIGKGEVRFSPSIARERHQLELVYKKGFLQDRLNYVFMRCSNSLFENNVRIEKSQGNHPPVDQTEKNRAHSLFAKHYPRSFTVENSLDGKLLSFIPQGEEAVIEFEGKKTGKFTYIFSPFSEEEVTLFQWEKERFLNIYSPQAQEGEKRFFISFGEKFDVQNYAMDIDFDPADTYISGKAEIDIESKTGNLDKVQFKLNPNLEILRITDENDSELFFTKDRLRKNLYVYFLNPVLRNQSVKVIIYYRGTILPSRVVEDAISSGQVDDLYLYTHPRSETYLYSLNAQWYPVPAEGDYFTARVKIIVPPDFSVVANGLLVEQSKLQKMDRVEELDEIGRKVSIYESRKPIKYMSFIVGKLQKESESSDPFPLSFYRTLDVILPRLDFFEETKRILQYYESKFGSYPFESLSIILRIWQESGGHSPASFIVLNQLPRIEGVRLERASSPVNLTRWSEYYLAHEIAHQWWGQGVTWDRYHDQWISEGLAQFATILYLKEKHGESAFSDILKKMSAWTEKKAKWGPIIFGSRISHFDFYAFQSIIYNKSSLVLNMLKDLVGEEVFFQGVKEFFARFKYRAAKTNDFVVTLSEISGQDLKPFFEDWFKSYKLPDVKVSSRVERVEGGFRLKFHIAQLTNPFIFPLWVEWIQDGKAVRKMIVIDKKDNTFEFTLTHKPKKISINPDKAIPGKFQ
jgi:hypothetical protein